MAEEKVPAFKILQAFAEGEAKEFLEEHGLKYTESIRLRRKDREGKLLTKPGDELVVGGRVTKLLNDVFNPGNFVMTLDDGLDEVQIYLVDAVYLDFKDLIQKDNILMVKGYYSNKHEVSGVHFVVCTSMELVSCSQQEEVKHSC